MNPEAPEQVGQPGFSGAATRLLATGATQAIILCLATANRKEGHQPEKSLVRQQMMTKETNDEG